jgi:chromosomal replication initiator protein
VNARHAAQSHSEPRPAPPAAGRAAPGPRSPEIGDRILSRLSEEVGRDRYERYFDRRARISIDGTHLDVTVADDQAAELIHRRFGTALRRAASAELDSAAPPDLELRFRVDRAAFQDSPDSSTTAPLGRAARLDSPPASPPSPPPAAPPIRATPRPRGAGLGLRYRLESFVVGASNRLAYNSALALAEGSGQFASLFIHGSCGLGKTHLLQGVANRFSQINPAANIRYTTGESFTNEFITALRTNRIDQFRRTYRAVDLLCLDDVHFLANKDATQIELLHTFDAIGLDGAKVALASDEHPREIRRLSEQLVSRFLSGVVVRLDPPELELRQRIVKKIAEIRGLDLEDASVKFIADRSGRSIGPGGWARGFGGSVRDIEGMLTQVEAVFRLLPELTLGSPRIGLVLVRKALGISEQEQSQPGSSSGGVVRPRRPIHIQTVISEVCRALRVDLTDFQGNGRHKRVVLARGLTVVLARQLTAHSYPEIARAMNRPNHSTVVTAFQRLQHQMEMPTDQAPDVSEVLGPEFTGVTLRDLVERLSRDTVRASD